MPSDRAAPPPAPSAAEPRRSSRGARRLTLIGVACAFLLVYLAQGLSYIHNDRAASLEGAERTAQNLAGTLKEHGSHAFIGLQLVLSGIAESIRGNPALLERGNVRTSDFLHRRAAMLPQARALIVTDGAGLLVLDSAVTEAAAINLADRDYVRAHREAEHALYIGNPVSGRTSGLTFIPVSVPVRDDDGALIGVVTAIVEPDYFLSVYRSVDVGRGGAVALLTLEGRRLVGTPPVAGDDPLQPAAQAANREFSGAVALAAPPDRRLIVGYHRLEGLPLLVAVALDEADVLQRWRGEAMQFAGSALLVALAVAVLVLILDWQMTQKDRTEGRLRDAIDSISEGFALYDSDERLVLCNERYRELYQVPGRPLEPGMTFGEVLDATAARIALPPDLIEQAKQQRMAAHRQRTSPLEIPLKGDRTVLISQRPTADGGIVAIHTEVTMLKSREAEAQRARLRAEQSDRAKTEFVTNVSHELRTPLNAIIGFAEIMEGRLFGPMGNPRYDEYPALIAQSGRYLLQIINDILDLAKLNAGRMELSEEAVALPALVEACEILIGDRLRFNGLSLGKALPPDLPAVRADRVKLKQVLLNLLSNAVKFTPPGGAVRLEVLRTAEGGLAIAVADTGIGMTEPEIALAMEPFRQIDGGLTRKREGTGLGLPLAQALVELHGGRLDIASQPGAGTTVTVILPADRVLERAAA